MEQVISDVEAREHFDDVMRRVVESNEAVIVERDGARQVVVLPVAEYERMRTGSYGPGSSDALERLAQLGDEIRARRGGQPLTEPDEIIHEMREERNAEIDQWLDMH